MDDPQVSLVQGLGPNVLTIYVSKDRAVRYRIVAEAIDVRLLQSERMALAEMLEVPIMTDTKKIVAQYTAEQNAEREKRLARLAEIDAQLGK